MDLDRRTRAAVVGVLVLVGLASCGEPRLDGSSSDAWSKSIDAVKKPLTSDERRQFEDALLVVGMKDVTAMAAALDPEALQRRRRDSLDHKTAREVIAEAKRLLGVPDGAAPSISLDANERSAVSTLRNLAAAEPQWREAAKIDVDLDGDGEFGFFREMSGVHGVRTSGDGRLTGQVVDPPILSQAFRHVEADGTVERSGYLFCVFLPGRDGTAVAERTTGAFTGEVDADRAETTWCCYAWPKKYGETGRSAYFVNQTGVIVSTDCSTYSGPLAITWANADAAFKAGVRPGTIDGSVAVGGRGRDGQQWSEVK